MKVLIVSATAGETALLQEYLHLHPHAGVTLLVGGIGMPATAYALTKQLCTDKYDLVIQVGVGGSFNRDIALGEVVLVTSERYGDLGAEDHDNHLDIFDMGLIDPHVSPYTSGALVMPEIPFCRQLLLRRVSGLTVNRVSGNEYTIAYLQQMYHRDVESMEGAAFHYVCLQEGVTFMQVRAISNYVIPRDKSQWRMKEAIVNLNQWVMVFLTKLEQFNSR